jgi:hypothetical protein
MVYRLLKCWLCYTVIFHVLISSSGCKEKAHEDSIKSVLTDYLNNHPTWPEDVKERTRITLAKYENKTLGSEPVLLLAIISRAQGYERPDMGLLIVDQNEDVIGIGIREDCHEPNCCWKTIDEIYPVYMHTRSEKIKGGIIPLHIRDNCQKKDESAWSEYLKLDYQNLLKDWIQKNKDKPIFPGDFWESTLPPVWVSKPEPNKLDILVWVFDKAGNKSEPIKLIDHVDWTNKVEPITEVRTIPFDNDKNKHLTQPAENTPKSKTAASNKAHRRLDDFKFDKNLTVGKVHAIWGPPDVEEGFGVEYLVYELEDGRQVWLLFASHEHRPLLKALIRTNDRDAKLETIFDGMNETKVR